MRLLVRPNRITPVIAVSMAILGIAASASAAPYTLYVRGAQGTSQTVGQYDSSSPTGVRGTNLLSGFTNAEGLAVGSDYKLYVANGNQIDRYTAGGAFDGTYVSGLPSAALGLAFDSSGKLYASGNFGVRVIPVGGGSSSSYIAANAVTSIEGDTLQRAFRITFGPDGKMYIPDDLHSGKAGQDGKDKVYSYDGTTLHTVFTTPSGTSAPCDVDFGPDGNLYVAMESEGSGKIQKVVAGVGSDFLSLQDVYSLQFTPDGRVYADSWIQGVVKAYDATTGALLSAVGVSGTVMDGTHGGVSSSFGPAQLVFMAPEPTGAAVITLAAVGLFVARRRQK